MTEYISSYNEEKHLGESWAYIVNGFRGAFERLGPLAYPVPDEIAQCSTLDFGSDEFVENMPDNNQANSTNAGENTDASSGQTDCTDTQLEAAEKKNFIRRKISAYRVKSGALTLPLGEIPRTLSTPSSWLALCDGECTNSSSEFRYLPTAVLRSLPRNPAPSATTLIVSARINDQLKRIEISVNDQGLIQRASIHDKIKRSGSMPKSRSVILFRTGDKIEFKMPGSGNWSSPIILKSAKPMIGKRNFDLGTSLEERRLVIDSNGRVRGGKWQ